MFNLFFEQYIKWTSNFDKDNCGSTCDNNFNKFLDNSEFIIY